VAAVIFVHVKASALSDFSLTVLIFFHSVRRNRNVPGFPKTFRF